MNELLRFTICDNKLYIKNNYKCSVLFVVSDLGGLPGILFVLTVIFAIVLPLAVFLFGVTLFVVVVGLALSHLAFFNSAFLIFIVLFRPVVLLVPVVLTIERVLLLYTFV
jgi:hypothetical protein